MGLEHEVDVGTELDAPSRGQSQEAVVVLKEKKRGFGTYIFEPTVSAISDLTSKFLTNNFGSNPDLEYCKCFVFLDTILTTLRPPCNPPGPS